MKILNFRGTLLTDVIISAQTATEGRHESLSFIPGSNFLGIVASAIYKKSVVANNSPNYYIFHSGKVRFGDAHIVHNNHRSFQVPFSLFYPKGSKISKEKTYMADFMLQTAKQDLIKKGIVLQQLRNGYFTSEGFYLSPEKIFSLKSAYDKEKRRPKDNAMFGYESLQEGSEWQFSVEIDGEFPGYSIVDLIKQNLIGEKFIGRSKTAEFGRILIEQGSEVPDPEPHDIIPKEVTLESRVHSNEKTEFKETKPKLLFLYADSRLAFFDKETVQPTFSPSPEDLGLPKEAKILWKYSQIRTGVYAPWNRKRACRDEDRAFIEKGSVITVDVTNVNPKLTDENIIKGVGYYKTEGFGKLLVNPDFLDFEPNSGILKLGLKSPTLDKATDTKPPETLLIKWLIQQKSYEAILKSVDVFVKTHGHKFNKVTKSQWGNVRDAARQAKGKEDLLRVLFTEGKDGSLMHGVAKDQWNDGRSILENEIKNIDDSTILPFIEKFSDRMQKEGGAR